MGEEKDQGWRVRDGEIEMQANLKIAKMLSTGDKNERAAVDNFSTLPDAHMDRN